MIPSRLVAGSRWGLLALLVLLACALNPTPIGHVPAAARAVAPTASASAGPTQASLKAVASATAAPVPVDTPAPPVLATLVDPVRFIDTARRSGPGPSVAASSGILVDIDTNRVLWSLEPHTARYPASTLKLMTALVALQNFNPDQLLTIQPEATRVTPVETRMEFVAGEHLTVRELLQGVLTISANDAAMELAYGTVGMPAFVATMNRQLHDLGLVDSHFAGTVGYPDDPGAQASAYDLAAIATAEYRHFPMFRDMVATPWVTLPASPNHHEFQMHNINRLLEIYPASLGGKSGYTDLAGPCLVSIAARNGHHLVGVLMNANKLFDQSRALLEWGFLQEGLVALPLTPAKP